MVLKPGKIITLWLWERWTLYIDSPLLRFIRRWSGIVGTVGCNRCQDSHSQARVTPPDADNGGDARPVGGIAVINIIYELQVLFIVDLGGSCGGEEHQELKIDGL